MRPLEKYTALELINAKEYAESFIKRANALINAPGGWIAREANWAEIENAESELKMIKEELSLR